MAVFTGHMMSWKGPNNPKTLPRGMVHNYKSGWLTLGPFRYLQGVPKCLLGDFPIKKFGGPPPPQKSPKLFYNEFSLPTFEEGTSSFVSGGPFGPMTFTASI